MEKIAVGSLKTFCVLLALSLTPELKAQEILDSKEAICSMFQSARHSEKEMGFFFLCGRRGCAFLKIKAKGQKDAIQINGKEFQAAIKNLQKYFQKHGWGNTLSVGLAHTHPDKTIKDFFLKQKGYPDVKHTFLSLPPSVVDLDTHKYFSNKFPSFRFLSLVVDSHFLWIVSNQNTTLALSRDEYEAQIKVRQRIANISVKATKMAAKFQNGVYPKKYIKKLQDEYARLALNLKVMRLDIYECQNLKGKKAQRSEKQSSQNIK